MKVPYHRPITGPEELEALREVLESGWLTSGSKALQFEKEFAAFKGVDDALAVNSCTSGLFLILKSLNLEPECEVITTPVTFAATANMIFNSGALPVFTDIDPATGNMDPGSLEEKITTSTRAIVVVHLGGTCCNMDAIGEIARRHKLWLIEDCAHAYDATWDGKPSGTMGDAAAFSFYPTKNITTGEGGMVLLKDPKHREMARLLRNHGMSKSIWDRSQGLLQPFYDIRLPGYKLGLSDLQAALGLVQMKRWPSMKARLDHLRKNYEEKLAPWSHRMTCVRHPEKASPGYHLFMILVPQESDTFNRDVVQEKLSAAGVETSMNYRPLHMMTWYFTNFGYLPDDLHQARIWGDTELSLPFYPAMTDAEQDYVIAELIKILDQ